MGNDLRFKKYIISTVLSIFVLLMAFTFFYILDYGGQGFVFDGETFQLIKVSSMQITLCNVEGDELSFAKEGTITLVVEYNGNTLKYGGGHSGLTGIGYTFSDGTKVAGSSLSNLNTFQQKEVQLLTELHDYFDAISLKYKYPFYYSIMLIFVSCIVAFSIYMLAYTEECWDKSLARKLFIRGGAPTGFALLVLKIVGIAAITASSLLFLSFLFR